MTTTDLMWYGIGFLTGVFLGFGLGVKMYKNHLNKIMEEKEDD